MSLGARYTDAFIEAFTPLIFTSNMKNIFPAGGNRQQTKAIRRRFKRIRIGAKLMAGGRLLTHKEKTVRRSAGQAGPRAPPAKHAHPQAQAGRANAFPRVNRRIICDSDED